jgi:hypothetical protein
MNLSERVTILETEFKILVPQINQRLEHIEKDVASIVKGDALVAQRLEKANNRVKKEEAEAKEKKAKHDVWDYLTKGAIITIGLWLLAQFGEWVLGKF